MASPAKAAQQLARQLFKLTLVDGVVSSERVAGVLEYIEKHKVAKPIVVLKAYHRLVATEIARSIAVVEHAGVANSAALDAIAAALSAKYARKITWATQPNPTLLAGLRVRVGDDVYESSVSGQLATLGAAV